MQIRSLLAEYYSHIRAGSSPQHPHLPIQNQLEFFLRLPGHRSSIQHILHPWVWLPSPVFTASEVFGNRNQDSPDYLFVWLFHPHLHHLLHALHHQYFPSELGVSPLRGRNEDRLLTQEFVGTLDSDVEESVGDCGGAD